jgi:hypothetical protein
MRKLSVLLSLSCLASAYGGELVDFKPEDCGYMLKVPAAWVQQEQKGSYRFLLERKDNFSPSFHAVAFSPRMTPLEFLAKEEKNATYAEEKTRGEIITEAGEKGHWLSILATVKGIKARQTHYVFQLNHDDIVTLSAIRLDKDTATVGAEMEKCIKSLKKNPEYIHPKPGGKYVSKRGKFSLITPPFLSMLALPGNEFRLGIEQKEKPYGRILQIGKYQRIESLAKFADFKDERQEPGSPKLTRLIMKTSAGVEGLRLEGRGVSTQGVKYCSVEYCFLKDNEIYNLLFNCAEDEMQESYPAFDAAAKSFQFE